MALTAYYSAGTATLTNGSTAVVGIGTAWTTNNLAPGDQIETDSGLRATIASINSPTSITLDKSFAGTTQTAAPYKIWRTFDAQYLMEGARVAFNLLGSGSIAALASLAGDADNGMYFTAPGVLALFSLTAAGRALLDDADAAAQLNTLGVTAALDSLRKRGTVRVATTANITIATALNNGDSIDGVALVNGDLVLVKNQTAPAENGVYVVGAAPARSTEYDTYNEHPGALIVVQEGTTQADTLWSCTSNVGGILGTTGIAFSQTTPPVAIGSVTGLAANMAAFLAGGTSAQLAATLTDETGSGPNVFANAPTITGAPVFSGIPSLTGGGLKFPATQVPSADANTLDDYEEGTWTPSLTFVTPGNLAVTYSSQAGTYVKVGNVVSFGFLVLTSTFTHTTASGLLQVTGLPFGTGGNFVAAGALVMQGYTKANYTSLVFETGTAGQQVLYVLAGGSGQTRIELAVADVPTGTAKVIYGSGTYNAS